MVRIDPQRVLVARCRLGMGQTQLAKAISRSQPYISKLEAGVVEPDESTVNDLAAALDVPVIYFRSTIPPVFPHTLSFHRTRKSSQSELNRLWAEMNMIRFMLFRLLASAELHSDVELPSYDVDDVPPEAAANFTRAALGVSPGPIKDLVATIERAGVVVCGFDFRSSVTDGVSHQAMHGLPPLIFVNTSAPGDRMRWSLAHELGHLILHRYGSPQMENEADRFAAQFLMPEADIKSMLKRRLDLRTVGMLKLVWGCSMQSIYRRAKDLAVITDRQYKRAMVEMSPMRKIEPHPLVQEATDAVGELWSYHIDELGFAPRELASTIPVPPDIVRLTTGFRPLHLVGEERT